MGSRVAVAVVVAWLVVLAGCGAFSGGPSEPDRERVTPAPVTTTEQPTQTDAREYPPGLYANGSVDADRLAAAHGSLVANRSYTWEFRYRVVHGADVPFDQNFTRLVTVDSGGNYLLEQSSPGISPNLTMYVGDEGYLRTVRRNETRYERVRDPGDHRNYAFTADVVRRYLTGIDVDVSVVERNGRTYYRLYSADYDVPPYLERFGADVWNYSATAYVTPAGLVRTVAVEYQRDAREGDRWVSARFDYDAGGSSSVSEPDWVSRVTPTPTPYPRTESPTRTVTPAPTANASSATPATESATVTSSAGTVTATPTVLSPPPLSHWSTSATPH